VDEEFGRFVAARVLALCRTAYLLTGDWQAGEDLVQEALTRTYLRRRRLRGESALEPYARKALVSIFLTSRRRHWHREVPHEEIPDVAMPRTAVSDDVDDRDELWAALMTLSPQQRAVLVLRYFEDLTEHDIATVLGCSPGAVKTHAARGLGRLRQRTELSEGWSR
jgi:RNA polymerase sigma-70 factor (sigma-E family)